MRRNLSDKVKSLETIHYLLFHFMKVTLTDLVLKKFLAVAREKRSFMELVMKVGLSGRKETRNL